MTAARLISCSLGGASKEIAYSKDLLTLKQRIGQCFGVNHSDVLGLRRKEIVFPLSFMAKFGQKNPEMFSCGEFEVVLKKRADGKQDWREGGKESMPVNARKSFRINEEVEMKSRKDERDEKGEKEKADLTAFVESYEKDTRRRELCLGNMVRLDDLVFIKELTETLELGEVGIEAFFLFFEEYSRKGLVSEESFELFIWDLVPRHLLSLTPTEVDHISLHFSKVFELFVAYEKFYYRSNVSLSVSDEESQTGSETEGALYDQDQRTGEGNLSYQGTRKLLEFRKLFIGLITILRVPDYKKLEFAVAMYDSEELGYVHKIKLLALFRCFIICFIALCPSMHFLSTENKFSLVDKVAMKALQSLTDFVDEQNQRAVHPKKQQSKERKNGEHRKQEQKSTVTEPIQSLIIFSLDQILTWYTERGHKELAFLQYISEDGEVVDFDEMENSQVTVEESVPVTMNSAIESHTSVGVSKDLSDSGMSLVNQWRQKKSQELTGKVRTVPSFISGDAEQTEERERAELNHFDVDSELIFSLEFPNRKLLNISSEEVKTLDLVVTATHLGEVDPKDIIDIIAGASNGKSELSQQQYNKCIRELVSMTLFS